jgi:serine/threonine protein kinase
MATIHSQSDQSSDSGVHSKFPKISGFTILEHLHEGSHSSIYRARQERLGRVVALKLLPEWPPPTDVALERFNRAAYVSAQAPHANLLTLYDTGTRDGFYFASLEFVAGQTLQRQLAQVPHTDEAFALQVGLQVARALTALHAREICHRNVKPKNIFVETNGQIRLIGLGLASCKTAFFSPHLDAHAIGTPHFMAPEMIRGCCADPRSDLYSLGVTLYLMTAGRPPFEAGIPAAVMTRHLTEAPRSLAQLRPDLSPEFVSIVHTLIARDPEQRFQSARDAADMLEALGKKNISRPLHAVSGPEKSSRLNLAPVIAAPVHHHHHVKSGILHHPITIAVASALATVLMLAAMTQAMAWIWSNKDPEPAAPAVPVKERDASPAELAEFERLEARSAEHLKAPAAGYEGWALFLKTYRDGSPTLRDVAKSRMELFQKLMKAPAPERRVSVPVSRPPTPGEEF